MDDFLKKLPGSIQTKALIASASVLGLLAIPVFGISREGRQGHDYFSHEKPEAIHSRQEKVRREYRELQKQEGSGKQPPK